MVIAILGVDGDGQPPVNHGEVQVQFAMGVGSGIGGSQQQDHGFVNGQCQRREDGPGKTGP